MVIQISNDLFINLEQVNYIKSFTDIVDKKERIYISSRKKVFSLSGLQKRDRFISDS